MIKRIGQFFFLLSLMVVTATSQAETPSYQDIATAIQTKYETNWMPLTPRIQAHYATRLYRITGDNQYVPAIFLYQLSNTTELLQDWANRNNKTYVANRSKQLLDYYAKETNKRVVERRKTFANNPEMAFNLNLLVLLYQAQDYGLLKSAPYDLIKTQDIKEYFKKVDFEDYLLDEQTMRVYSAQLANYIIYLKVLGLADLEQEYMDKIKKLFFAKKDAELSSTELEAKAYGLTHIILAASLYYQKEVLGEQYQWIEDYFQDNSEYLLKNLKTDVIMEIGLVFLLRGHNPDHPIVEAVKQHIAQNFSVEDQLLPGIDGNVDLNKSEHRNVLALMVLEWPEKLHAGPNLPLNAGYQTFTTAPFFAL